MKKINAANILAFLAIIISIIVAIPSFIALNESRTIIYYSVDNNRIEIPNSIDKKRINEIFIKNNIPNNSSIIEISNKGNKKAKTVEIASSVPGKINYLEFEPELNDKQILAKLLNSEIDSNSFKINIGDFYEDFNLKIKIGYFDIKNQDIKDIQIIYDDFKAQKVKSAFSEPKWTYWTMFKTPVYILLIGLGIALLVALIINIMKNEKSRQMFYDIIRLSAEMLIGH